MESSKFIGLIKSTEFEQYINCTYDFLNENNKIKKILEYFHDYFEIGCIYLINNHIIIKKLLIDIKLTNEDSKVDEKDKVDNYLLEYFKKNPTHIMMFEILFTKYVVAPTIDTLIDMIYKYKELLLDFLVNSKLNESKEQVNIPKEQVNESTDQVNIPKEQVNESTDQVNQVNESTDQKERPKFQPINSIEDMIKSEKIIIDYTNENPFNDVLVCPDENNEDVFVIGLMALDHFTKTISKHKRLSIGNLTTLDTRIFILNCSEVKTIKIHNTTLCYTKFNSIEEALLSIAIPICRVAIDQHGKIYATVQAVATIFGNPIIMPEYTSCDDSDLFARYMKYVNDYKIARSKAKTIFKNIKGWSSLGFKFNFIKTDDDMIFIKLDDE